MYPKLTQVLPPQGREGKGTQVGLRAVRGGIHSNLISQRRMFRLRETKGPAQGHRASGLESETPMDPLLGPALLQRAWPQVLAL